MGEFIFEKLGSHFLQRGLLSVSSSARSSFELVSDLERGFRCGATGKLSLVDLAGYASASNDSISERFRDCGSALVSNSHETFAVR